MSINYVFHKPQSKECLLSINTTSNGLICPNMPSSLTADLSPGQKQGAEMIGVPGAGMPKVTGPASLLCSGNLDSPFVSFFLGNEIC